jgi:type IV pilus biogenesis protein CpaD/CtpE
MAALGLALGLGACSEYAEYMDRKDTIAFSAGNAVQTNIVTQVPDPWPSYARNRNIATDGERMQNAVERYRTYDPKPQAQPSIIINAR